MIKRKHIFSFILVLIVLGLMINPFLNGIDTTTNKICYESICIKYNLENYDNCKDAGFERVGFMTTEHFYICDGNKITKTCIKRNRVVTNRSKITLGMECEEQENEE